MPKVETSGADVITAPDGMPSGLWLIQQMLQIVEINKIIVAGGKEQNHLSNSWEGRLDHLHRDDFWPDRSEIDDATKLRLADALIGWDSQRRYVDRVRAAKNAAATVLLGYKEVLLGRPLNVRALERDHVTINSGSIKGEEPIIPIFEATGRMTNLMPLAGRFEMMCDASESESPLLLTVEAVSFRREAPMVALEFLDEEANVVAAAS